VTGWSPGVSGSAVQPCASLAQRSASTTLLNSTRKPSPIFSIAANSVAGAFRGRLGELPETETLDVVLFEGGFFDRGCCGLTPARGETGQAGEFDHVIQRRGAVRQDVEEPAHRPGRVRPLDQTDRVAPLDDAFDEDSGIPAGAARPEHGPRQPAITETQRELEAGLPELGHLKLRRADRDDVANADRALVEARHGEVLAETAWHEDGRMFG
jgi:hypothetical protein